MTAVLFLVFNRPSTTERVFRAIQANRPERLYIASDGPRADVPGESEVVQRVRDIVSVVDWPCEVRTLFRDENLGCGASVSQAIDWFFSHEEEGVILEDDCLPSPSFFPFCASLLDRYREDFRVWHIAGHNQLPDDGRSASYLYSGYGSIWGWATWRSRWNEYRFDLGAAAARGIVANVLSVLPADEYPLRRQRQIESVIAGLTDTWDYQWFFARLASSGLSVVPTSNLVENIGFGIGATHTNGVAPLSGGDGREIVFPLVAPEVVVRDRVRDIELLDRQYAESRGLKLIRLVRGVAGRFNVSGLDR